MPPFGHSVIAFASASSSVGAQERCSCRIFGIVSGSLPASRAPSAKRSNRPPIFSSGAPTVMMPSANLPVFFALIGPGRRDEDRRRLLRHRPQPGRLHLEEPALVLDVLAGQRGVEELVDDLDRLPHPQRPLAGLRPVAGDRCARSAPRRSRGRASCGRGTSPPASPRPAPRSPGGTGSSGTSRPARGRPCVRSPTAVSTFHTNAASPCCGTHGWKWSAAMQPLNPCCLGEGGVVDHLLRAELLEHRGVAEREVSHGIDATWPPPRRAGRGVGLLTPSAKHLGDSSRPAAGSSHDGRVLLEAPDLRREHPPGHQRRGPARGGARRRARRHGRARAARPSRRAGAVQRRRGRGDADHGGCACAPTSSTPTSGTRRCSPARSRRSTRSPTAGSSSASVPAT